MRDMVYKADGLMQIQTQNPLFMLLWGNFVDFKGLFKPSVYITPSLFLLEHQAIKKRFQVFTCIKQQVQQIGKI